MRCKCYDNQQGENTGKNNEPYPCTAAAQKTKSSAIILNSDKADDPGNQRSGRICPVDISIDPEFYQLVKYYDQHSDN